MKETPYEYLTILVETIEKTRKKRKLRQKDLCTLADVPIATYQAFLYEKKISITALIKIMYALRMEDNLNCLCEYNEPLTLDEIRLLKSNSNLPKRIRVEENRRS